MDNLVLIGAIGKNNELGYDNSLIWYIPDDMKFFRDTTLNHTVVMGYNTFLSLPKHLDNRINIVLTRKDIKLPDEVIKMSSKEEVLHFASMISQDIFIIGGAKVYEEFINDSNRMILTEIDKECKIADTYFPKFNKNDWDRNVLKEGQYKTLKYEHVLYKRKK